MNENGCLNGKTILISGVDSAYHPKLLLKMIMKSGAKDLTLVFIEGNTDVDPEGDPLQLVYNGQVKKVITSHLGNLSTKDYNDYLEEFEVIPMGLLVHLVQAGANNIPGIVVEQDYAALYRSQAYIHMHSGVLNGNPVVMEPAIRADLGLSVVDVIDIDNYNARFEGTVYNNVDVVMASDVAIVEYFKVGTVGFDEVRIPGLCIDLAIKAETNVAVKTNWEA